MNVHVVIPWRAGDPRRHRIRRWVIERWVLTYPDYLLRIAEQVNGEGEWCKAFAVMPVIEQIPDDDIVIVADADVWANGWISIAAGHVQVGDAKWAVPHRQLRRLSEKSTDRVLAGQPWAQFEDEADMAEQLRVGVPGGGMVIARAGLLKAVPLDPRYVGWGQEDHSWGKALRTIAGEPWRPRALAPMVHLWHPPAERITRTWGNRRGVQLYSRYCQADRNLPAMLKLIGEIDRSWAPDPEPAP